MFRPDRLLLPPRFYLDAFEERKYTYQAIITNDHSSSEQQVSMRVKAVCFHDITGSDCWISHARKQVINVFSKHSYAPLIMLPDVLLSGFVD